MKIQKPDSFTNFACLASDCTSRLLVRDEGEQVHCNFEQEHNAFEILCRNGNFLRVVVYINPKEHVCPLTTKSASSISVDSTCTLLTLPYVGKKL